VARIEVVAGGMSAKRESAVEEGKTLRRRGDAANGAGSAVMHDERGLGPEEVSRGISPLARGGGPVELEQVVGGADQAEFGFDGCLAAPQELAEAEACLEVPDHGLGQLFA
jgi:hypothetical protein